MACNLQNGKIKNNALILTIFIGLVIVAVGTIIKIKYRPVILINSIVFDAVANCFCAAFCIYCKEKSSDNYDKGSKFDKVDKIDLVLKKTKKLP
ncbi:MAG: hypothetical protein HRK26_03205 [Rickettsiaceae bacterium H1]|nr:hypothetical protein [Rickettsiaceae bacterium H1]